MEFRRHWVFFGAVLLWTASSLLLPTWIGRSYSTYGTGSWHESGVFGLEGGDGWYKISPIWSPPRAQAMAVPSDDVASPPAGGPAPIESREVPISDELRIDTQVHWPLTPNPGGSVIEVCWTITLLRLFAGLAVLGAWLRVWTWATRSVPDATVTAIWRTTLSLAASLLVLGAIAIFSFGTLFTDGITAMVLSGGAIAGLVYAKTSHESPASDMATGSAKANALSPVQASRWSVATILLAVFYFLIGLTASCLLLIVVAWTARPFRGPIRGVNELGGAIYLEDQTSIQLAAGAVILIGGFAAAAILRSVTRTPSAFAMGLAAGATILGVCVACGM